MTQARWGETSTIAHGLGYTGQPMFRPGETEPSGILWSSPAVWEGKAVTVTADRLCPSGHAQLVALDDQGQLLSCPDCGGVAVGPVNPLESLR